MSLIFQISQVRNRTLLQPYGDSPEETSLDVLQQELIKMHAPLDRKARTTRRTPYAVKDPVDTFVSAFTQTTAYDLSKRTVRSTIKFIEAINCAALLTMRLHYLSEKQGELNYRYTLHLKKITSTFGSIRIKTRKNVEHYYHEVYAAAALAENLLLIFNEELIDEAICATVAGLLFPGEFRVILKADDKYSSLVYKAVHLINDILVNKGNKNGESN